MKKIIRLTESELRSIIKRSVNKIIKEDILGNNFHEADEDHFDGNDLPFDLDGDYNSVMNNYEPFETQLDNEHDWGVEGEEQFDPTEYDPEAYMDYGWGANYSPSDNDLYARRA